MEGSFADALRPPCIRPRMILPPPANSPFFTPVSIIVEKSVVVEKSPMTSPSITPPIPLVFEGIPSAVVSSIPSAVVLPNHPFDANLRGFGLTLYWLKHHMNHGYFTKEETLISYLYSSLGGAMMGMNKVHQLISKLEDGTLIDVIHEKIKSHLLTIQTICKKKAEDARNRYSDKQERKRRRQDPEVALELAGKLRDLQKKVFDMKEELVEVKRKDKKKKSKHLKEVDEK